MWGQVWRAWMCDTDTGIIPTRVGTSGVSLVKLHPIWDHPHACGDKQQAQKTRLYDSGSSPRVWGQAVNFVTVRTSERIIPTRVGTSLGQLSHIALYEDHPHACGDKLIDRFEDLSNLGSSPRVWGQVSRAAFILSVRGIIPTRVGTSITTSVKVCKSKDHPHACGDKTSGFTTR